MTLIKRICTALILVFGLYFGPAWAFEDAGDVYLREMTVIADALESVKDDASARAAAEAMGAAVERAQPSVDEIQTWSEAEKRAFVMGNREEIQSIHMRISNAMNAILQNREYMELFFDHLQNLPSLGE